MCSFNVDVVADYSRELLRMGKSELVLDIALRDYHIPSCDTLLHVLAYLHYTLTNAVYAN